MNRLDHELCHQCGLLPLTPITILKEPPVAAEKRGIGRYLGRIECLLTGGHRHERDDPGALHHQATMPSIVEDGEVVSLGMQGMESTDPSEHENATTGMNAVDARGLLAVYDIMIDMLEKKPNAIGTENHGRC